MQRLGLRRRVDAKFLGETQSHLGITDEGRARPADGGVGAHREAECGLVETIMGERRFGEVGSQGWIAGRHGRLGAKVAGRGDQSGGVIPLRPCPRRIRLVSQELAPIESEGGGHRSPRRGNGPTRQPRTRLVDQLGQRLHVEPVDNQGVAGVGTHETLRADRGPDPAHEHRHLRGGIGRRRISPQPLSQTVGRNGPTPSQSKRLHERSGLAASQAGGVDPLHLEHAEKPDPKRRHTGRRIGRRQPAPPTPW